MKPGGAIKRTLETYADGVGKPYSEVLSGYQALKESDQFDFLRMIQMLEAEHQKYLKDPAGYKAASVPVLYMPDGGEVK